MSGTDSSNDFHNLTEQELSASFSKLNTISAQILKFRAKYGMYQMDIAKYYCPENMKGLFEPPENGEKNGDKNDQQASLLEEIHEICKVPPVMNPTSPCPAEENNTGISMAPSSQNSEDNTGSISVDG